MSQTLPIPRRALRTLLWLDAAQATPAVAMLGETLNRDARFELRTAAPEGWAADWYHALQEFDGPAPQPFAGTHWRDHLQAQRCEALVVHSAGWNSRRVLRAAQAAGMRTAVIDAGRDARPCALPDPGDASGAGLWLAADATQRGALTDCGVAPEQVPVVGFLEVDLALARAAGRSSSAADSELQPGVLGDPLSELLTPLLRAWRGRLVLVDVRDEGRLCAPASRALRDLSARHPDWLFAVPMLAGECEGRLHDELFDLPTVVRVRSLDPSSRMQLLSRCDVTLSDHAETLELAAALERPCLAGEGLAGALPSAGFMARDIARGIEMLLLDPVLRNSLPIWSPARKQPRASQRIAQELLSRTTQEDSGMPNEESARP